MKIVSDAIFVPLGRSTVRLAAPTQPDPVANALLALVGALGLEPDASPDEVSAALDAWAAGRSAQPSTPAKAAQPKEDPDEKWRRRAGEPLSKSEIAICAEFKIDHAAYERTRAISGRRQR